MTPRKLTEWVVALLVASVSILAIFAIARDVIGSRTPLLDQLLGTDNSARAAVFVVAVAAAIALAIVRLFRATKGNLEFEAIGIKFRGPSGPVLLWTVSFLAVCGAAVALLPLLNSRSAVEDPNVMATPGSAIAPPTASAVEPSAPSYRVAVKYALITNHHGCGDSSSAEYAGMEPQWALRVNGDLVSSYVAPQKANFKTGSKIPGSGSLVWTPQSETDHLRFDGDVCDLDGDPPRCQLRGSIQEFLGVVDGKLKLADGSEPKYDADGYLVLAAVFESDCGFSIHVAIAPLA